MYRNQSDMVSALQDPDWARRFLAVKAIGENRVKAASGALLKTLSDPSDQVRAAAVIALRQIGDPKVIDELVVALADPSEWVRVQVVNAIGRLGKAKHAMLLAQFLENEESNKVRATILRILGEIGGRRVVPIILLYLRDPDNRVRANAVEALDMIGAGDVQTELLSMISDQSNRVKANAAKALYRLGHPGAIPILKEMILSGEDMMRASAAWGFGEVDSAEAIAYLVRALEDRTWFVVKNAVKALAKKGAEALPALQKMLGSHDPTSRINAIAALTEIGLTESSQASSADIIKDLIPLTGDENGDVRAKAEESIDRLNHERPRAKH